MISTITNKADKNIVLSDVSTKLKKLLLLVSTTNSLQNDEEKLLQQKEEFSTHVTALLINNLSLVESELKDRAGYSIPEESEQKEIVKDFIASSNWERWLSIAKTTGDVAALSILICGLFYGVSTFLLP